MAVPVFRAAGTGSGVASGSAAPTLPSGHVLDDILLLLCEHEGMVLSVPSGYAAVADSPQAGATSTLAAFWKRDNGSESAPTVPVGAGNHVAAIILAFSGCIATGDPWDVTSGSFTETVAAALAIPGDTTTVADCLVVTIGATSADLGGAEFSAWANADLSSFAEIAEFTTGAGNGGGIGVAAGGKATPGAYGTTTATLATSGRREYLTIALKPVTTVVESVGFLPF